MELWQRFTHRARRAIIMAHDEASRVFQTLIGTEHILSALLRLGEGRAFAILAMLGVDTAALLADIRRRTAVGEAPAPSREISFTPEAQRVLQLAYSGAREMNHRQIGTEHVLLGLVREARGPAYEALHHAGVTAEAVKAAILAGHARRKVPARRAADTTVSPESVATAAVELLRRAQSAAADMRRHLEEAEGLLEEIAGMVEQPPEETGSGTMEREVLATDRIPPAVGPYSQAVRAEGMIFCSGIIGLDPESKQLVEDSFEAQVRRVLDNLTMLLEDCGTGLDRVVKTTVFLVDMGEFATFNGIYAEYFDEAPPARSTIQVAALPLGAQIEVEAIALA